MLQIIITQVSICVKIYNGLLSPENRKDINDYIIFSDTSVFDEYTSPIILSTPANYILAVYEYRKNPNTDVGYPNLVLTNLKI